MSRPRFRLVDVLVASRALTADARLHAERGRTSLTDLDAAAGPVHVEGRVTAADPGSSTSVLLLTAGPLTVGVEATGAEATIIFAGARDWFDGALRRQEPAEPVGTTAITGADIRE